MTSFDDSRFKSRMNMLGKDGWELVTARRATSGYKNSTVKYEVILKRKVW